MRLTAHISPVFCLVALICLSCANAQAQNRRIAPEASADSLRIDKIFIVGNRKTKEQIIRRELTLREGFAIARGDVEKTLELDKNRLINTRLFLTVDINLIELSDNMADLIVRVNERWYFFPIPIFNLADRNFTEWWVNQNRDLSRIEYGINLKQYNFRGRNETVGFLAQFGFTQRFRLSYQIPYIDRDQRYGLTFYVDYSNNKNISALTIDHRLQFFDSPDLLRERFQFGANFTIRPSFYSYHQFGAIVSSTSVADTILQINPNYLLSGNNHQQYIGLYYSFTVDRRDYVGYPLQGWFLKSGITKTGIGLPNDVDITRLDGRFSWFTSLGKRFYFASNVSALSSWPGRQPYNLLNGIGYLGDAMRGYEPYVIEGQHYVLNNNSFRRELFKREYDIGKIIPLRQFRYLPVALYLSFNFDQGYVANLPDYELNTRFTDRYLVGGGFGLDLVTSYDFVTRFDYSFNIDGESSFFLNLRASF